MSIFWPTQFPPDNITITFNSINQLQASGIISVGSVILSGSDSYWQSGQTNALSILAKGSSNPFVMFGVTSNTGWTTDTVWVCNMYSSGSVNLYQNVLGGGNNITFYTDSAGTGNAIYIYNYNTNTEVMTLKSNGYLSVNGIKTTAGAATTVSVGTSPYTYTNSSSSNQQVFIEGGTISAMVYKPAGTGSISLAAFTDNIIVLRPTDAVTITYTSAPTINTVQL